MPKALKIIAVIVILFIVFIFGFVFRPIGFVTLSNSTKVSGETEAIFDGSSYDISFRIKNDSNFYYVNRGAENGLNAEALNDSLQNKEITLYYVSPWSLINPERRVRHITRVLYNGQIIYDEIGNFE